MVDTLAPSVGRDTGPLSNGHPRARFRNERSGPLAVHSGDRCEGQARFVPTPDQRGKPWVTPPTSRQHQNGTLRRAGARSRRVAGGSPVEAAVAWSVGRRACARGIEVGLELEAHGPWCPAPPAAVFRASRPRAVVSCSTRQGAAGSARQGGLRADMPQLEAHSRCFVFDRERTLQATGRELDLVELVTSRNSMMGRSRRRTRRLTWPPTSRLAVCPARTPARIGPPSVGLVVRAGVGERSPVGRFEPGLPGQRADPLDAVSFEEPAGAVSRGGVVDLWSPRSVGYFVVWLPGM